jgi:hypothetical protein
MAQLMGLAAWERRTYFDDRQRVAYAEARGREAPEPGSDGARLSDQARRMATYMSQRSTRGGHHP